MKLSTSMIELFLYMFWLAKEYLMGGDGGKVGIGGDRGEW